MTTEISRTASKEPMLNAPFVRKSTGLVRELALWDMFAYDAAIATPIGVSLALSLFFVYGAFPGANLLVALLIGFAGATFTYVTFALLSSAMPRIGGDYTFISRILHPALALASNVTFLAAELLAMGWITTIAVRDALAPAFAQIGTLSGNAWWIHASQTVSKNGWTFLIASVILIASAVIAALGTRLAGRTMTILYFLSFAGSVATLIILAVTSHHSFVHHLNTFAKPITHSNDTYSATVAAGQKAGIVYPDKSGYSVKSTIGAIVVAYGLTFAASQGVYMSGEMKGAGRRRRQLSTMFVGGYGQAVILFLTVLVLTSTLGYNFFASASNGHLAIPVAPYSNFFVGIATGSTPVAGILALMFLFGIMPWLYSNAAILYRGPFAWAFDGLVPRRITSVNKRTHTPILAIVIMTALSIGVTVWAAFTLSFLTVFAYLTLFGYFTVIMVSIAALAMPRRLPDVFRGSAADWRIKGVPVLPIVALITILWNTAMIALIIWFHTNLGVPHIGIAIAALCGTIAGGIVFYYVARAVQRSRGVDISLAYRAIPPE